MGWQQWRDAANTDTMSRQTASSLNPLRPQNGQFERIDWQFRGCHVLSALHLPLRAGGRPSAPVSCTFCRQQKCRTKYCV